ncbi:hypothetical protein J2S74_003001 [Evansella vedderi]|uniref:Uncharacterized protein n=1 Tax=Evansella vedderi TaxID=38282 RepID=A0ABT9ZWK9_9BACI|nr:hypothetical protein [Evansella vedderi]MDQ0255619.1 hypothetical protein [Evansella vedderi]
MGIDFSKYPKAQELIQECEMEDKKDQIIWLQTSREEAAVLLAEMHQMIKAGMSTNIGLRKRSKIAANFYYKGAAPKVHVFAREQARLELGLSNKEVGELFAHCGFGGMGYV